MGAGKLLGQPPEDGGGVQPLSDIDGMLLGMISHIDALRQFVGDSEPAGGVVHQGFQQQAFIPDRNGGRALGGPGLGNVKDLPNIVGHAHAAIVPLVLLARFQDGDSIGSMSDIHAAGLPAVKVGQSGGLRALGRDQDGVAHGVEVKPGLHIQVGLEQPALSAHILHIAVDHGVDALTFRLLSRRPSRLVKGLLLLLGGLAGKQIIIVRHTLSLLFDFLFRGCFVLEGLLPPSVLSDFLLRPLFLLRPYLLQCLTDRRTGALQRIRDTRLGGLFEL